MIYQYDKDITMKKIEKANIPKAYKWYGIAKEYGTTPKSDRKFGFWTNSKKHLLNILNNTEVTILDLEKAKAEHG